MTYYADDLLTLHLGDCVEVMRELPAESVDAVVTDPPYGLEFMGKEWDRLSSDPDVGKGRKVGLDKPNGKPDQREGNEGGTWFGSREATVPNYYRTTNAKCRTCGKWRISGGHDGKGNTLGCKCEQPDFPNVKAIASRAMGDWHEAWAREALRVAKPGAHLLAFGGTRTYHRLASAIEDAGWEIRDCLVWAYASGFPKSRNLDGEWTGWGTALKPAWEPIVLARKPLRGTVAANVLAHGTGALNIGATRIGGEPRTTHADGNRRTATNGPTLNEGLGLHDDPWPAPAGRWPPNLLLTDPIFDGGVPGVVGGGQTNSGLMRGGTERKPAVEAVKTAYGTYSGNATDGDTYGDSGSYSRFFLIAKSSRSDREPIVYPDGHEKGKRFSTHPTQKPTELMRHLVRLVTPPGGTVLDPFLGSGTTAIAANAEGFRAIGIEREQEYLDIAVARLAHQEIGLGLDVAAPVRKRTTPSDAKMPKPRWPKSTSGDVFAAFMDDEVPA